MLAFFWVCIFIARRAVKLAKPVRVFGKVRGNPIDYYAYPRFVALYKIFKIVGRAVARSNGVITRYLIAPRAVKRVLRDRHKLNMGIAHIFYILCKLPCKVAVCKKVAVVIPAPRAEMKLVNIHGRRIHRCFAALFEPL